MLSWLFVVSGAEAAGRPGGPAGHSRWRTVLHTDQINTLSSEGRRISQRSLHRQARCR